MQRAKHECATTTPDSRDSVRVSEFALDSFLKWNLLNFGFWAIQVILKIFVVFNLAFSSFYNNHLTADVKQCITKAVEGKGWTGLPLCEIDIQARLWRWWACQWPTPYLNGPKKIWRFCWRPSQSPWLLRPWRGSRWLTSLTGSDRFYSLKEKNSTYL